MTGTTTRIKTELHARCLVRLDALDAAIDLRDLNIPGFNFHGLRGKPKRYSIHVNGPYCITFEWKDEDAWRVDFENYH